MTQRMRGPSILFVEDDGAVRREVCRELAERGLHTVEADDPASAMEALANSPTGFSLLVTDLDVLPIGVIVFPGTGIQENLADKARKLGIPVWKFGNGGA